MGVSVSKISRKKKQKQTKPSLHGAILNNNWFEAYEILQRPDALEIVEYAFCDHVLHLACARDAPLGIIRSLIEYSFALDSLVESKGAKAGLLHQDDVGNTPLHWACIYSSAKKIHYLLEAEPEAAKVKDNSGKLPLHYIVESQHASYTIKQFLTVYPEALISPNRYGETPLWLFFKTWNDELAEIRKCNEDNFNNVGDRWISGRLEDIVKTLQLMTFVYTAEGVLDYHKYSYPGYQYQMPLDKHLLIHKALKLPDISHIFIELLFDMLPEEELSEKDIDGNGIVHVAVSQPHCTLKLVEKMVLLLQKNNVNEWNYPNKDGRLPLALAIECGHLWSGGILQYLIHNDPNSLSQSDTKTKLVPFLLAGSCTLSQRQEDDRRKKNDYTDAILQGTNNEHEFSLLDITYELLRMDPTLVKTAIG